jgi:DNA-binding NarL/FixJ family response regulator
MHTNRLGRALALGLATVAAFWLLSALSMPVADRRLATWLALTITALMAAQAALYWSGEQLRARFGLRNYLLAQAAIAFAVGMSGALVPVGLALYLALTAEAVVLAGPRFGTVPIAVVAIIVFGTNAILTSNLYFGATAALLLAVTSMIAQAITALVHRRAPLVAAAGAASANGAAHPSDGAAAAPMRGARNLTPREDEVLRALSTGSRSSEIASQLGITERTVKAHLASIYQKLGVESRTEAIAAVLGNDDRTS